MPYAHDSRSDRRRGPRPRHWGRPQGSRTLVLGICLAVGGVAGSIRGATEGAGLLEVVGLLVLGAFGVLLAIAWVLEYARKS
ncbi:hypothetical protein [Streptomyces sp. NPDC005752]|uniref:hypothetical protein n=1 Tax=Streptomyces sp. NPDC005752 TaxID=3157065 RepID=UPI0033D0B71F